MNAPIGAVYRRYAVPLDVAVALAMTVGVVLEASFGHELPIAHRSLATVTCALVCLPVAARRWRPAAALTLATAVAFGGALLGAAPLKLSGVTLPLLVLAYAAGALADVRRATPWLVAAAGFALGATNLSFHDNPATDLFWLGVILGAPWFAGRLIRQHTQTAEAFAALARQTAAERAAHERAIVGQVREEIERDLQGVVAQEVAAMVVQAAGARRLLATGHDATVALEGIEAAGRDVLGDLRRLLGVLRKDGSPGPLSPLPGVAQLPALVVSMNARGLLCTLDVEGAPAPLSPGIDLAAYRLVEAALAAAHACRAGAAAISLLAGDGAMSVEVRLTPQVRDLDERLAQVGWRLGLYGARLDVHSGAGDTSVVQARLPTRALAPL